jgi:peptidoglycan/LPS O-acetylase OafA/YrhL
MTMADSTARDSHLVKPLTSIRFFAAMAVVIFHAGASTASANPHIPGPFKTLLLNGYVGVTFFFVLSGFILQYTYRGSVKGGARMRRYGIARFARIYPVYVLAALLMLPFAITRGWFDVPQFFLLQMWTPPALPQMGYWNLPSWTLSVEVFFYLCFPIVSAWASRTRSFRLFTVLACTVTFIAVTASPALFSAHEVAFGWMAWIPRPALRFPEFVYGICLAEVFLRRGPRKLPVPAWILVIALIAGLSITPLGWSAAFAALMSGAIIIAVASDQGSRFARLLSARWLVLLGGASYSLYLLHQPVHFALARYVGDTKLIMTLQYPLAVFASVVVFLAYEEPLRERIRKWIGMKPSVIEPVAAQAN